MDLSAEILQPRNGAPLREHLGTISMVCPDHGDYTSTGDRYLGKQDIWTRCPGCAKAELQAMREREVAEQAAKAQQRLEAMLEETAIPRRFIGRTLDNFTQDTPEKVRVAKVIGRYIDTFDERLRRGDGLILSGVPGTGKSHLAGAVLQGILPRHVGAYMTCLGLIRAVRNSWAKGAEYTETEVLARLANLPLLVIDEVGVQYGTEGEQTLLFEVLDRRYRDMRPTILLTNEDPEGLKSYVGARVFDRLTETATWINLPWETYRQIARKEASGA